MCINVSQRIANRPIKKWQAATIWGVMRSSSFRVRPKSPRRKRSSGFQKQSELRGKEVVSPQREKKPHTSLMLLTFGFDVSVCVTLAHGKKQRCVGKERVYMTLRPTNLVRGEIVELQACRRALLRCLEWRDLLSSELSLEDLGLETRAEQRRRHWSESSG